MSEALRFTVYFDGTANNKDQDTPKGIQTNVAKLFELDDAKGTNLARNSGHAPAAYDAYERSGKSEKIYFDGVGSQGDNSARAALEGATGLGGHGRVTQAYDAIVAFHNKYPTQKIDLNIVGFSRGAAQARALANFLNERGVPRLDAIGNVCSDYLISPGKVEVNKIGIFDTVASYGNPLGDSHFGKRLEINDNVNSVTHLVAVHEYRKTFRLTSALRSDDNTRIEEMRFAGAHSQVGGGYKDDVLAAGPLAVMYDRLQSAGIVMRSMAHEDLQRIEAYNEAIKSPGLVKAHLIDSRVKDGQNGFRREADGSYRIFDNTPFPLERGMLYSSIRQSQPFSQEVNGRDVLFEHDDSLSKNALKRGIKIASEWLATVSEKLGDIATEYSRGRTRTGNKNNKLDKFQAFLGEYQDTAFMQSQIMASTLAASRPDEAYIGKLKLQTVPVPTNGSAMFTDDHDKYRAESYRAMQTLAKALDPAAGIRNACVKGRAATSGVIIDVNDYHILQRVGRTNQFVIHDRRDVNGERKFSIGKSTAILSERNLNKRYREQNSQQSLDAEPARGVAR
ncbi:hypothetical protein EDP1_54 [Pseudomonas putida S610]|uniref:phospholipase effector Tle1 domain-containing protein n=1 Tax=Pseudomonas putida group TaxID=136845 RepID=UPI0003C5FC88|nr:DUF2235 domain-containing protein [Pseudomonas putida]EST17748.1 hypothetical protein EDP1_54 [Pseudomonas putida S610]